MKRKLKYLFIFVMMLFCVCDVSAKQKLICTYETEYGNDWEIIFDRKYELHLTLDNSGATVDKLIFTSNPKDIADCKQKACLYTSSDDCDSMCKKDTIDNTEKAKLDGVNIKEGDGCPKLLYFSYDGRIYLDKEHGAKLVGQKGTYTNKVYCGRESQGRITRIPKKIPELTSSAVTIVQVAIPIILVVLGTLDLFKGITAGKEDEIKKGQQMFIKRLAVAAVIFFVVIIVKFFISVIADTNQTNIIDCINCFIDNDCKEDFS